MIAEAVPATEAIGIIGEEDRLTTEPIGENPVEDLAHRQADEEDGDGPGPAVESGARPRSAPDHLPVSRPSAVRLPISASL